MASRLILINGVPASGKSTLARDWCERHAGGLPWCLDVDAIRATLGGWRDDLSAAGLAARDIAVAGVAVHLRAGRDVVVPQYLRRPDFIDRLEAAASTRGALFIETALTIDPATAQRRFADRAAEAGIDRHGELQAEMTAIVREFEVFLASRPRAIRLAAGADTLSALEAAISAREAEQRS
ncbi:MAG: ATP-binding protein [Microbacteriaceae bacterium]|nr:ATP-binding protein [Microbacteriaceae bacterium]MCL2795242.1 ATP-binding protein [Microbacteriaceae bacterium]